MELHVYLKLKNSLVTQSEASVGIRKLKIRRALLFVGSLNYLFSESANSLLDTVLFSQLSVWLGP